MKTIDDQVTELGKELDPKWEMTHVRHNDFVSKPWGTYEVLFEDYKCKVKQIVIHPGKSISLQSHDKRDEFWKLVQGEGEVIIEGCTLEANSENVPYSYFIIRRGLQHRITNTGDNNLVFIEIQTGDSFSENDLIRYEDDYGRTSPNREESNE